MVSADDREKYTYHRADYGPTNVRCSSTLALPSKLPDIQSLNGMEQAMIPSTSIAFVSQHSIDAKVVTSYGLGKQIEPVKHCRQIGNKDMKYNDTMPKMKVDPEKYVRRAFFKLTGEFNFCLFVGAIAFLAPSFGRVLAAAVVLFASHPLASIQRSSYSSSFAMFDVSSLD